MREISRHAYLILCHDNFRQLANLLSLLDHPRTDIFIHVDEKSGQFPEQELRDAVKQSGLYFTRRIQVHWGAYSMVEAELILLDTAVKKGNYAYFHLLSGQDLPLKPLDEIYRFFDENSGGQFISFTKKENRYLYRVKCYFPLMEFYGRDVFHPLGFLCRVIQRVMRYIQLALGVNRLRNAEEEVLYGSQWFSITGSLAREILSRRDYIRKRFIWTNGPDEFFVQTIAANSPLRDSIVRDNLRMIDFSRKSGMGHPHIWSEKEDDFNALISSGRLFARKFDERTDPEIIRAISQYVRGGRPAEIENGKDDCI